VADAPLSPSGTTFTATVGQAFNGVVGSFLDTNPSSAPTDFAIRINWGDGQTSVGTAVLAPATQTGALRYNVTGTHVYAATGSDLVSVTIVRSSSGQTITDNSTANVIAPVLNIFPANVSGAPNQPLTSVALATVVDSSTTSKASDFSATIQWGTGLPITTATVTGVPAQPGQYTVVGTFTYPAGGTYHPVIIVVRTTLNQSVTTTSTVDIAAPPLVGASMPVPFNGGVDPLSRVAVIGGVVVTNQQEPVLTGTATPGSSVSLFIRRLGLGDPIPIGETVADPSGRWSLVVGPLGGPPFLLFGVETPVEEPPSPITLLNGGLPIFVTNRSLHATERLLSRRFAHVQHRSRHR
jgi:hypothetical protein